MRTPILSQLYAVFDEAVENEKLFAFCNSVPDSISLDKPLWLNECLMKEKNGNIVERKFITLRATRVVDIRPICVIVETPCIVYICLKPGVQNYSQGELKKALGKTRAHSNMSCDISYAFYTNCQDNDTSLDYCNSTDGTEGTISYDKIFDFGNAFMTIKEEKIGRNTVNFKIQILINKFYTFFPQIG